MLMETPSNDLTLLVSITHEDGAVHNIKLNTPEFFDGLFDSSLKKERLDNSTAKKFNARYVGDLSPKNRMLYRVKALADTVLGYESTPKNWDWKLV